MCKQLKKNIFTINVRAQQFKENTVIREWGNLNPLQRSLALVTALRNIFNLRTASNLVYACTKLCGYTRFRQLLRKKNLLTPIASASDCSTGLRWSRSGITVPWLKLTRVRKKKYFFQSHWRINCPGSVGNTTKPAAVSAWLPNCPTWSNPAMAPRRKSSQSLAASEPDAAADPMSATVSGAVSRLEVKYQLNTVNFELNTLDCLPLRPTILISLINSKLAAKTFLICGLMWWMLILFSSGMVVKRLVSWTCF